MMHDAAANDVDADAYAHDHDIALFSYDHDDAFAAAVVNAVFSHTRCSSTSFADRHPPKGKHQD